SFDEGVRCLRQHRDFLPHLLGAAQWQSTRPGRAIDCCDYGTDVRSLEVRLYPGAAAAEFSRNLWPVCPVGEPDVLGVSLRIVDADGSTFVGPRLQRPRCSVGASVPLVQERHGRVGSSSGVHLPQPPRTTWGTNIVCWSHADVTSGTFLRRFLSLAARYSPSHLVSFETRL